MKRLMVATVVSTLAWGSCAFARPAVDTSPGRAKYRVAPLVLTADPHYYYGNEIMELERIGTLRPKSAAEVGDAGWVIHPTSLWEETKDYIAPLGLKSVRLYAAWDLTERETGVFDFSWLDERVDFCLANGLNPILETSYGNPNRPNCGGGKLKSCFPSGDDGLAAWDDWIDRLTTHFKGRVVDWSGWNEPDVSPGYGQSGNSPEEIAVFCARTARDIRKNIPDARIAGLSLGTCDPYYIERILDLTGKEDLKQYDYFIYHGYRPHPESLYDSVNLIERVVRAKAPHMKLWQGENGCPSEYNRVGALADHGWTEISQAKWDMRRMLGDKARGIRSTVFALSDFQRPGAVEQNRKGLLRTDADLKTAAIKPAYYAVQNVASVFDAKTVRSRTPAPNAERAHVAVFAFEREGLPILAFWDTGDGHAAPGGDLRPLATRIQWLQGKSMKDPVWVDLLSGRVYAYPKNFQRTFKLNYDRGDLVVFDYVPCVDSPCLLAERAALEIVDNQRNLGRTK